MKRSRDDGYESSQSKRPAASPRVEPSGQAQTSTASSAQKLTTNDALSYLKTVKEIFQDKKDKYDEFLDVMKDFKAQRIDTSGVIYRVKELFKDNRKLIKGFSTFLPKGYEIILPPEDESFLKKKPVEFEEAISFVNKIKTRFQGDDHVYKSFLDILNMYRKDSKSITEVYREVSILFQHHADLLVEFTHFLPDTSGTASVQHPPPGRKDVRHGDDNSSPMIMARTTHVGKYDSDPEKLSHAEKEMGKREDVDRHKSEHDDSLDHKRKSAHQDNPVTDQFNQGMLDTETAFHEKLKERIQDPEKFKQISDCIRSYKSKFVPTSQFRVLLANVLGAYPDLMEACEDFITYSEKTGSLRSKPIVRSSKVDGDGVDHYRVERDKNRDRDNGERDRHDRGIAYNTRDALGQKASTYASRDKFFMKPIQELDLSNCQSCTPSYRLLPDNYPMPSVSCRTEIGREVLNDCWVSVTSGSEDYSFKHMRKNQYEESLFRCEDDRFELDMLLDSVNTTAKRVEELLNSVNSHANKAESSFCIEDHLTPLNLRCIERLYGDHGLDVMDVMKKTASLSLPIILTRLKQKQEEWARCRADFNKVWADIYAKNYHKSLDHRSFYFKQQDARNLSAKVLLAEMKEISERNHDEYKMIFSIGAGYKQPMRQMEFEYPDPDIQEDLYKLMKYFCEEVCTREQQDKIMKIWTDLLEPLLGIPSHLSSTQEKEYSSKFNNCAAENLEKSGEVNGSPADEASNSKLSGTFKNGDNGIPTEHSCSGGVQSEHSNFMVDNGHGPDADYVAWKSNISCNAPRNRLIQTDTNNPMSLKSGVSNQSGLHNDAMPSIAGEKNLNEDCVSGLNNCVNGNYGIVSIPSQEPQGDVITKPITSAIAMVPEVVTDEKCRKECEVPAKPEAEEGELSPRNPKEKKIAEFGSTGTKEELTPSRCAPSPLGIGGEEIRIVPEEDDANGGNYEESAWGSSDTENASENGDVSMSESANGEECSPNEPDDDRDDNKAKSEGEADGVTDVPNADGAMFSDLSLQTVKPLTMNIPASLQRDENNSLIFYGNDSFYLLFRLHQILYERMLSAKLHSSSPENKWRILNDGSPNYPYVRFKDALNSLLNGSSDNAKFEDECRAIVGAQSYVLFTLDKLIHKLFKQLQTIATDEMDNKFLQLYGYEVSRNQKSFCDAVYLENARFLLPEDNLYRIECSPSSSRLTIQLVKIEHDKGEPMALSMDPNFTTYLNDELLAVAMEGKGKPGVFLERNKRKICTGDEVSDACNAMEGLTIRNGIEIKVNCNSMKAAYVVETEDYLYRMGSRRRIHSNTGTHNGCSQQTQLILCVSQQQHEAGRFNP